MKTIIVLGRGTEGCGVTQCAIQMQKVTGATILSANDKKWGRAKGLDIEQVELSIGKEWDNMANIVNEFDLCIVYSIPSKTHPEDCQENFLKLLDAIKIRKAFINVDHKSASIARNANLKEVCEKMDVIMTHSMENDFCKFARKNKITVPIKKMGLGFDYDGHREKYWKPIEQQQHEMVRWIGRTAMWKGPALMIDFHQDALMKSGFITVLEGLEASIQYPLVLYRDNKAKEPIDRRKVQNYFRPEKKHGETEKFKPEMYGKEEIFKGSYLYPQYINSDCMERMSLSAFGSDLYHLKAETYGSNIENCHAECIASGTVPLFHKHFCDNVIHPVQDKPISQCKDSGTLGVDYNNMFECRDQMVKLKNDPSMRDDWREMAFEFWKQHSDAEMVVNEIIELATSTKDKPQGLEEFFV
tara:strand:- start:4054 stop:5295 length:1242 start_codon:yes stop_codon:yes gene_type:complete